MTAPTLAPIALWTAPLTVQLTAYDYGDGQPPLIQGTLQMDGGFAALGFPAIKGDKGDDGDPGVTGAFQGTVASASALPAGLNSTTDVAKFWQALDDYKLYFWTGSVYRPTGSIRGLPGPPAAITSAADYTGRAPAIGDTLRFTSAGWAAYTAPQLSLECTSGPSIPNDQVNWTTIPFDTVTSGSGFTYATGTSGGNDPSKVTVVTPGLVRTNAVVSYQTNPNGSRGIRVLRTPAGGGSDPWPLGTTGGAPNVPVVVSGAAEIPVAAGDTLQLQTQQTVGSAQSLLTAAHSVRFSLHQLRAS